ncbi:MAG TPA: DUF4382 domain-containing protein [Candidatus Acidoferrum sp.]|nr:DUF4382 domain-containing protein [Candidatus Acidoferrum sp.]
MVRLAFGTTNTKSCSSSLLALLCVLFTGCSNSCFFGFWNPPNGTIGTVLSNPPPACRLATPKGAIRVVIQLNHSCELCSGSNRVHTVVLNLRGIDIHSSANAEGESSGWQELLPELEKRPRQIELLNEKVRAISSESKEELRVSAGSYDLVRLSLGRDQVDEAGTDDGLLPGNECGKTGPNCVVMADGQIVPLVLEADTLEFRLVSEATVDGLPFVLPDSNNELLIEMTPVLSMARPFGEPTPSFSFFPGRAHMEPSPWEEQRRIPEGI